MCQRGDTGTGEGKESDEALHFAGLMVVERFLRKGTGNLQGSYDISVEDRPSRRAFIYAPKSTCSNSGGSVEA